MQMYSSREDILCCVPECRNYGLTHHLHCFPKDIARRRQWLVQIFGNEAELIDPDKFKRRYVCHDHFDASSRSKACHRIKLTAVPSIGLRGSVAVIQSAATEISMSDPCTTKISLLAQPRLPFDPKIYQGTRKLSGCNSKMKEVYLHRFPKPKGRPVQFQKWVAAIGGELNKLNPSYIYSNRKVCQLHFVKEFHLNKTLARSAIPTLNLKAEPRVANTIEDNDENTIEDFDHDDITHEEETCVSSSKGQVPQKDRLKHCLKDLDIRDKKLKTLCNNINIFSRCSLTHRAELIDRFYSWLTDLKMSDSQRTICVNILMEYREMWPEVANHPFLLRRILTPKVSSVNGGLFDEKLFNEHIKPLIVELYKSREMKVRLQLLDSLQSYIFVYTEEEVKMILLPEILIGMQDSDKMVVRATLMSLAQLVDVLGPTAVIGGQRQDIFVQTEVAARETVEKATDLDEPQSCVKEENKDSANESEEERDPLDLREVKCRKGRKRKKRTEIESKDDESETELDWASNDEHIKHNQNIQSHKRRPRISLNESEEERDTLDVQERITNTYTEVEYLDCESGTELDLEKEATIEHDKPILYKRKSQRFLKELSDSQFSNRSNSKDVSALSKTRSSSKRKQILTKDTLLKDDAIS